MAYVPDDAIKIKRKVSRSAWDVYEALCAFADSDTGVVEHYHFSYPKLVEWSGCKLGTARNAMTELRHNRWIEERPDGRIFILVGTFLKALREAREAAARARRASLTSDAPSPASDTSSLVGDAASPASDGASPANDARIDKERARGFTSPNQPSTSPETNTHTPTRAGLVLVAPAASAGGERVCVCGLEVSLELLERYARNQTPRLGGGWVNNALRGCTGHELVKSWLARQSAPAERPPELLDAKHCPDCSGTGFIEPGGPGKGVKRCPHAGLYAQLAEAVQARAHAPP